MAIQVHSWFTHSFYNYTHITIFISTVFASCNENEGGNFKQFMHLVLDPQKRQVQSYTDFSWLLISPSSKSIVCPYLMLIFQLQVQHGCPILLLPIAQHEKKTWSGLVQAAWMPAPANFWHSAWEHYHWWAASNAKSDG